MNEPTSHIPGLAGEPGAGAPAGSGGPGKPAAVGPGSGFAASIAEQHAAGATAKRTRGQRGPDKKPRARRVAPGGPVADPASDLGSEMDGDEGPMGGPAPAPPRVTLPPDLLETIGRELTEAVDAWNVGKVRSAAAEAGVPADRSAPLVDSVKMSEGRKAMAGRLTPLALQEWGAEEMATPTGALVAIFGLQALATIRACQALREEGEQARKNPS
jgi:hypothetical protein